MGLIKWFCKMFKCESSCMFNETEYNHSHHHNKLSDYNLKYKDMEKIHRILSKRQMKLTLTKVKDIMEI